MNSLKKTELFIKKINYLKQKKFWEKKERLFFIKKSVPLSRLDIKQIQRPVALSNREGQTIESIRNF